MMPIIRPRKLFLSAISILLVLSAALGCDPGGSDAPAVPAATAQPFGGKLLMLQRVGPGLAIVAFESGSSKPRVLWADLPGALSDSQSGLSTIEPVVSPDGKYALLPGSLAVVNLATGGHQTVPVPDEVRRAKRHRDLFVASFSPDSRYLAFALTGRDPRTLAQSSLSLVELAAGTVSVLFEGPCGTYAGQGTVCGQISAPVWLDPTTLMYVGFVGPMPRQVTSPGWTETTANHTSILAVDGKSLREFDRPLPIASVAGGTAIVYAEGVPTWLGTAELKQGNIEGTAMDDGFLLSPDGRFAYYAGQGKLVELRTGASRTIASQALTKMDHVRWSPDGKQIAVWNEATDALHVVSLESNSAELSIELDEKSKWWILGWIP